MTITRRLATAALPAAGLAVVAGALAFTGQAASAAPSTGHGTAPGLTGDAAELVENTAGELVGPLSTALTGPLAQVSDQLTPVTGQVAPAAGQVAPAAGQVSALAGDTKGVAKKEGGKRGDAADLPAAATFGSGVSHIASGANAGILNGLQVVAPIQIAVNVCGNAIPILGSVASASCGSSDDQAPPPPVDEPPTPPVPPRDIPPVPLPTPVGEDTPTAQTELPRTGMPIGSLAGMGGLLTAGGAALQLAGVRTGSRYAGRHRRAA